MDKIKTYYIISSTGKYNFVQVAKCKHCNAFDWRPDRFKNSIPWCHRCRKYVNPGTLACGSFVCNSKYVLYKESVQLNLFDYGNKSVPQLSAVCEQTAT